MDSEKISVRNDPLRLPMVAIGVLHFQPFGVRPRERHRAVLGVELEVQRHRKPPLFAQCLSSDLDLLHG